MNLEVETPWPASAIEEALGKDLGEECKVYLSEYQGWVRVLAESPSLRKRAQALISRAALSHVTLDLLTTTLALSIRDGASREIVLEDK